MKRWALLVAGLYLLILVALTIPTMALAFVGSWKANDMLSTFRNWPYWVWVAVMVISQFALLTVQVRVASRRPTSHGSLVPPLLAAGLMIGGLVMGAISAIYEVAAHDELKQGETALWTAAAIGAATWAAWTVVFWRGSRNTNPTGVVSRQCKLLLRGSILELLIAIPTHIVARSRDYCCAGFMTFIGLTMGAAVMLFSFGPAVFVLFADRWQRLQPKKSKE